MARSNKELEYVTWLSGKVGHGLLSPELEIIYSDPVLSHGLRLQYAEEKRAEALKENQLLKFANGIAEGVFKLLNHIGAMLDIFGTMWMNSKTKLDKDGKPTRSPYGFDSGQKRIAEMTGVFETTEEVTASDIEEQAGVHQTFKDMWNG